MQIIVNKNPKLENYFDEFSKKWEIATSRLKPYLGEVNTAEKKRRNQKIKHDASSFVYLGGK